MITSTVQILGKIWRMREGRIGLVLVVFVLLLAILGPVVGLPPDRIDVKARFLAPTAHHWLGTDNIGRDLFARVAAGTRAALTIAVTVVLLAFAAGSAVGVAIGLAGGWVERIGLAFFDIISAFPVLILAFAMVALYGPGSTTLLFVVTLVFIPQFGRMARSRMLSLRGESFIEAERMLGLSPARIVIRHLLPNVVGPLIVLASMNIPVVVTIEAGLSFLGLGVQPPASSLGTLIKDGYIYLNQSWWPTIGSAAVLALTTLGATLFGEALRKAVDPRHGEADA